MDSKDRAHISSVTVMLGDDDLNPYVFAAETAGGFFVDSGLTTVQFFGTPAQLGKLGRALLDGAADMAEQLAANDRDRTTTPMGQERERARPCGRCGADTWNIDGDCDDCLDAQGVA